jgi:nicotinamidase/pyrazinamidase
LTGGLALVVVDGNPTFMPGGELPVPGGDAIVAPLVAAIRSGRFSFAAFSRDWHPPDHCSFSDEPLFEDGSWPRHGEEGTANADVHPALIAAAQEAGLPYVIISKGMDRDREAYSAFDGVNLETGLTLEAELRERGIESFWAAGLAGDICVKASVLAGRGLGFSITLFMPGIRFLDPEGPAVAEMVGAGAGIAEGL